jgi:hypothetical protein
VTVHERQAIREAALTLLDGATAAGVRVFKTRLAPLRQAELPAIAVYTDEESVSPDSGTSSPRELTRTVTLAVEGWVKANEDVDDVLDELALEIETAMDADQNLGGTAFDSVLVKTETGLKIDGERPMGCVHLEYAVTYHTDLRTEESGDDFLTANVRTRVNGAIEGNQTEDTIGARP